MKFQLCAVFDTMSIFGITSLGLVAGIISDKGTAMMVVGLFLMAVAMALDFVFRFRMTRIGHKSAWAAWPVFLLMWAIVACGIVAFITGLFIHFVTPAG